MKVAVVCTRGPLSGEGDRAMMSLSLGRKSSSVSLRLTRGAPGVRLTRGVRAGGGGKASPRAGETRAHS